MKKKAYAAIDSCGCVHSFAPDSSRDDESRKALGAYVAGVIRSGMTIVRVNLETAKTWEAIPCRHRPA